MLRINLLPSYVTQRRFTKRLLPFVVLGVALSVVLPLLLFGTMKAHLNELTQAAETAEAQKTANDALVAQAASTKAQVKPIQDDIDFAAALRKYIRDQTITVNTIAEKSPDPHSSSGFIYSSLNPGPGYSTIVIKASSPSVEQVGRYLAAMYAQKVFSSVAVDKIPGYPDTVQHRWYLGNTMVFADGAAASTGGGGGGGGYPGGGGGGYPGGGGGYPGGGGGGGGSSASTGPTGFNAANLGPNGPGNVPPGDGPPPPELTGGLPTASAGGGAGGYPGGTGGGYPGGTGGQAGGYSVNFQRIALAGLSPFATPEVTARILKNRLRQVRRVTIPKAFDLTVTVSVAPPYAPLTAPALPGAAPAAGSGGGGFPGAGGGYPGGGYPGGGGRGGYPGAASGSASG